MPRPPRGMLRIAILAGLAALAGAGAEAAHAEPDLLPPARQLFAFDAQAATPARGAASCAASQGLVTQYADLRRRAALARIAQLVGAGPGGDAQPLNGRGYAYPVNRDPSAELRRVEMEAQRLRALRAAGVGR